MRFWILVISVILVGLLILLIRGKTIESAWRELKAILGLTLSQIVIVILAVLFFSDGSHWNIYTFELYV